MKPSAGFLQDLTLLPNNLKQLTCQAGILEVVK